MIPVKFIDGPLQGSEHFIDSNSGLKVTFSGAVTGRTRQDCEYQRTGQYQNGYELCKFVSSSLHNLKSGNEEKLMHASLQMRQALDTCSRTNGKVIIGGGTRMFINFNSAGSYHQYDWTNDGILQRRLVHNQVEQAILNPEIECSSEEWNTFLNSAVELAKKFNIRVEITEEA